jgi:multidrug efflux pump subunit AcrA (membrane-fusion protein)
MTIDRFAFRDDTTPPAPAHARLVLPRDHILGGPTAYPMGLRMKLATFASLVSATALLPAAAHAQCYGSGFAYSNCVMQERMREQEAFRQQQMQQQQEAFRQQQMQQQQEAFRQQQMQQQQEAFRQQQMQQQQEAYRQQQLQQQQEAYRQQQLQRQQEAYRQQQLQQQRRSYAQPQNSYVPQPGHYSRPSTAGTEGQYSVQSHAHSYAHSTPGSHPTGSYQSGTYQAGTYQAGSTVVGRHQSTGVSQHRSEVASASAFRRTGVSTGGHSGSMRVTESPALATGSPRAAKAIAVSKTVTITPSPTHHGFTVTSHQNNGAQLVLAAGRTADDKPVVTAYRLTKNPKTGVQTRLYLDGHKIVIGPNYVARSAIGRPTFITHSDGTREALLPGGAKWFTEKKITLAPAGAGNVEGMRRTTYAGRVGGVPVAAGVPVTQTYQVVTVHNIRTYVYQPVVISPEMLAALGVNFLQPVVIGPSCAQCPPPVAAFDDPASQYDAPEDMLADEQIEGAISDGMNPLPDDAGLSGASAQDANLPDGSLQADLDQLRQQVSDLAASNNDLKAQLDEQSIDLANMQAPAPSAPAAPEAAATKPPPVHVSRATHEQIKREVKSVIDAHAAKTPLKLTDVIASAEAQDYVFQVSDIIDASDTDTGLPCILMSGDLVVFAEVPGDDASTAKVKIVSGRQDSCKVGSTLELSLSDLQDMLNAFSQRLENNVTKMHTLLASAAP